ncbi:hypothetical protein Tco_0063932 [Tanacetum coccineum]
MSSITEIKCVLSQKAFDAFCKKFRIPEETHPVLLNRGDTMHERPAGKIGLYTRFLDFANFRLPLSTFHVDILRNFRINISQHSVIGAAKVSHFEILCRVYGIVPTVGLFRCFYVNSKKSGWISFSKRSDNAPVCYTKSLDSLKNWNNHFFWVDEFACPVSFSWHTAKNITKDPTPAAADFNAQDYATLVAHPSPFRKFPEEFLCLVGLYRHYTLDEETYPRFLHENGEEMDLFAFIHTPDPTKVKVVERERVKDEPFVDWLFEEGGSGNQTEQGDFTGGGGQGVNIQPLIEAADVVVEDVAPLSVVQRLLVGAVLNVEVRGEAIPNLPFVASSVPATPEHSSHHSVANVAEAKVDSLVRPYVLVITTVTTITSTVDPAVVVKEKHVKPSLFFADSSSTGRADPHTGVFSDLTGSDFLVNGIRTVIDPDTDLQKHDQLFIEFNVGAARQMSLSAKVRMRVEYNIKEKRRLKYVFDEQAELLKVREREIKSLKAQLLLKEAEAAKAIRLHTEASKFEAIEKSIQDDMKALKERNTTLEREKNDLDVKVIDLAASVVVREREVADLDTLVHKLEVSSSGLQEKVIVYENCMGQLEKFQDDRMKEVNDKFDKLYADFIEMALHLEERFYPHLLTTISSRRWLLTHGMELAISKCLNSPEYLSALGAVIGKAIEKGMQDGLSAGITHGMEGRALTDVAAYNPSAEHDYIFALQHLQNVNFSLLAELRSNKDASIDTLMNILCLEETLAERLGFAESQPHVDQLMVPIHHSLDKVVIGATALSLALDVYNIWVRNIRENITNQRSALRDVFVPLSEPFFAVAATVDTTMALSTTLASVSTIAPISVDDYEVIGTDD